MFRNIQQRVLSLNKSNRVHPVLLIDEAHHLDNEILKEIRLLTNFQIDSYNALSVILCGLDNISSRFGKIDMVLAVSPAREPQGINSVPTPFTLGGKFNKMWPKLFRR